MLKPKVNRRLLTKRRCIAIIVKKIGHFGDECLSGKGKQKKKNEDLVCATEDDDSNTTLLMGAPIT